MYLSKSVANMNGARELAQLIQNPRRSRTIVVATVAGGQTLPWIDTVQIVEQAGDLVDVYLITTTDASWEFAKHMPEGAQVYGGAGRVYPVGEQYVVDNYASPLRMAFNTREGLEVTEQLISDALSKAFESGHSETAKEGLKPAGGVVKGIAAGRALVELDGRGYAFIAPELTLPGFAADELFIAKQRVDGILNPETNRLDVVGSLISQRIALGAYAIGDVVYALVHEVHQDSVAISLYPQVVDKAVTVHVPRDMVTGNSLDDLRDLLAAGDVVSARVYGIAPNWALVLTDIDDDEPISSIPSLLPSGPPWLKPPYVDVQEDTRIDDHDLGPNSRTVTNEPVLDQVPRQGRKLTEQLLLAIESKTAIATSLAEQVKSLGAHLEQAENDRELLRIELQDAKRKVNMVSSDLSKLRAKLRKSKTNNGVVREMPLFVDTEQGFRYLVLTKWAIRFPASEQKAKPPKDFMLGPKFLESLESVQGISKEKVADVVVEIITGIATELVGREVHRLREGAGGADRPVVREDGAMCWRASLQVGTSSARRIHYWILQGGNIEFSRVTLHDDFAP